MTEAMQHSQTRLGPYEVRVVNLWEQLVAVLRSPAARVLMEKAIMLASDTHPELSMIERTDGSFSLRALQAYYAGRQEVDAGLAFTDLHREMLLLLARVIGSVLPEQIRGQMESALAAM